MPKPFMGCWRRTISCVWLGWSVMFNRVSGGPHWGSFIWAKIGRRHWSELCTLMGKILLAEEKPWSTQRPWGKGVSCMIWWWQGGKEVIVMHIEEMKRGVRGDWPGKMVRDHIESGRPLQWQRQFCSLALCSESSGNLSRLLRQEQCD